MFDQNLAAIVVFGVLFAICMIGLFASSAASARLSGGSRMGEMVSQRSGSGRLATATR